MTILGICLIFFGIGAFIGASYAIIRYGIPTIVMGVIVIFQGVIGIFQGAIEGWKQGGRDYDEKYGHLKPVNKGIKQIIRETWQQKMNEHIKKHGPMKPVKTSGFIQTAVEAWNEGKQKVSEKHGRR